jgi:signal transduction histidine kinase
MERSLAILAIAFGIHVAVIFLLLAKYFETRSRYVAWWTAGATMLTARAWVEMSLLAVSPAQVLSLMAISSALLLAGAGFFLTGTASRDPRARGIIQAGLLGFGGLVFAAVMILLARHGNSGTPRLVTGLAAGVAFLLAAETYRRTEQILDDAATRTIYAGLLAVGINLIGWAWVPRTPGVIARSEFLGGLAVALFGGGIELRALGRAQRLVVLSQISAALSRTGQVEEILKEILQQAGRLLQLHTGWAFLRDPATGVYELAAGYQLPAPLEHDDRAALRGSCRCLDLLGANELTQPVNIVNCMRLEKVGIKAQHASVPLRTTTGIVGLMNLVLPSGRLFSQRELALLSTVGGEVGLAIEKTQLLKELQDKERLRGDLIKKLMTAYEDERRRIARELHDDTGQSLTALILNVEMLRTLMNQAQPALVEELDRLKTLAEATLEEVRKLIYDLRPTILDDLGLAAALRWYVHHQLEPRGLVVDLKLELGEARLDPLVETAAFRIAQEALWNVVKHAAATRVEVALALTDGRLRLRVKDNGRGFEGRRRRSVDPLLGGAGLGGMEERATLLGGVVRITSTPEAGTDVVAELPLPAPASQS